MSENKWFRKIPIGSNNIDASSLIDVNSTTKGARPIPSMSQAQRDAIISPATGLQVYNTTSNTMDYFNGTTWEPLGLESDIIDLQNTKQNISEKGQPNGYAPLDGGGFVPTIHLPSYVDDVLEFPDLASFPVTGETGKIYIAIDTGFTYRWSGSLYVLIGGGSGASAGLKLLNGGSLQVTNSGGLQLSFTADFNIEKVGQNFSDNIIPVSESPVLLPNSNDCAYVVPNDSGNLSVSVNTPNNVPAGAYIFARNQSGEIIVGDSMLIKEGEIKKLYYSTDNAASSSGINYIINSQFEENILNVTSTANISLSHNLGGALRGVGSLLVEFFSTAVIGNHVAIAMVDIDNIDEGKSLFVSFDYSTAAVTETDELQVVLYNLDAAQEEIVYGGNGAGKLFKSTTPTSFRGRVYLPTINNSYELRIKSAINRSATGQIYIDNVEVGPDSLVDSTIITDWIDYTPTFTNFGIVASSKFQSRRVGTNLEINGRFTSGVPVAAVARISLGYNGGNGNVTVDANKIGDPCVIGTAAQSAPPSPTFFGIAPLSAGSNSYFQFGHQTSTVSILGAYADATSIIASGQSISLNISVPILEFSNSSAVLSTTEIMNETVKVRYASNIAQSLPNSDPANAILNFNVKTYDSLNAVTTGAGWKFTSPKTAKYKLALTILTTNTSDWSVNEIMALNLYKNGVFVSEMARFTSQNSGIGIEAGITGEDTIELNKGDYIQVGVLQNSGNPRSLNGLQPYNFITIEEIPDFSVYSVYGETNVKRAYSNVLTPYPVGANLWYNITSLTFEPGEWDLEAFCDFFTQSTPQLGSQFIAIDTNPATGAITLDVDQQGFNVSRFIMNGTFDQINPFILKYTVNIQTTTTYYLKALLDVAPVADYSQNIYNFTGRKVK